MFTKRFAFLMLLACLCIQATYSQNYSGELVRLAERGNADAQTLLAVYYENAPKIHDEAVKWYKKAAEGDNPSGNAMHNIAKGYGNGRNGTKRYGQG